MELPEVNMMQRLRRAEMQGTDVNEETVPCECQLAWIGQGETDSLDLAIIVVKVLGPTTRTGCPFVRISALPNRR